MKKTAESIVKRVDLERNLPKFANNMAQLYNSFSSVKLSLNYYIFNQIIADMRDNGDGTDETLELFERLKTVISKYILHPDGSLSYDDILLETGEIKNEISRRTFQLMSYTDKFSIYEHVFNRIEYRYKSPDEIKTGIPGLVADMSDEEMTNMVIRYILSDDDNVLINRKTAEVVRELPVRMTKQRFFELLSEGLKVYRNGTVGALNDYLYVLESTAGLSTNVAKKTDTECKIYFEDFEKLEREFENISFSDITKEQYEKYSGLLKEVVELVDDRVSSYTLLAEIVNDVLVIELSDRYNLSFSKERKMLVDIIDVTDKSFAGPNLYENEDEIERIFENLEGAQEKLYEKYSSCEYVIDVVTNEMSDVVDGMNLRHIYECLGKMSVLVSSSRFVDFDKKDDDTKLNDDMLCGIIAEVIEKYKKFFGAHEKCVNRSVMAVTLSLLPVFFNNLTEIRDYIYNSLSQCRNKEEKLACKELLYLICQDDFEDFEDYEDYE